MADQKVGDTDEGEQNRHAEAKLLQAGEKKRADDHERCVEHIDGRDDAGAVIGAGPRLHRRERRNDKQAARNREPGEIKRDVDAVARGEKAGDTEWTGRRRHGGNGPAEIEREQTEQHRGDQRRQQHDAPVREPGGKRRADAHGDRKDREEYGDNGLGAADVDGHERRQQRQDQGANEPEPAHHDRAPPQPRVRADISDQGCGRNQNVAVDDEVRRPLTCAWDIEARNPARERGHDHEPGKVDGIAFASRRNSRRDGAKQDGEKGAAFDQRVAGRQLSALEMIRQDAVFDRTEQGSQSPECEDGEKQHDERMKKQNRRPQ